MKPRFRIIRSHRSLGYLFIGDYIQFRVMVVLVEVHPVNGIGGF